MKKVVIIGPESTGKSSLCDALSKHFETEWVREYARAYLLENGTNYTYDDLLKIAKGQLALEDEATLVYKDKNLLFLDTDMYVMKVWCEFVFEDCHNFILNEIAHRKYDLYLLCNTDLPWAKDELREYPDLATREKLFHFYKELLTQQEVPWVEIKGEGEQRIANGIEAVKSMLNTK